MSHEPASSKPRPLSARLAPRAPRRRVKLFAARLVPILCATLAAALVVAQSSRAAQDNDNAQPAEPARTQAAGQASDDDRQQQSDAAGADQPANDQPADNQPARTGPTPAPRVMRVYRIGAEFKPTPSPAVAPLPTPSPTPSPTPCPRGQTCPPPPPPPAPKPRPTPAPAEFRNKADAMSAGLNDIIIVEVARLKQLIHRSKCLEEQPVEGTRETKLVPSEGCRELPILLFIDGRPLKGMPPESGAPELEDGVNGTLRYHLQRPVKSDAVDEADVEDTNEHWEDLLGYGPGDLSKKFPPTLTRSVSVSVGLANEYPIDTEVGRGGAAGAFHLVRVRGYRLLWWLALLAAFALVFVWLVRRKDILNDRKPIAWLRGNRQRKAFSLARSQIAWWTFFVVFGFIFIWLVTGQYDLSESVLVLLGISVVTTAGSVAIDKTRTFDAANDAAETDADLSQMFTEKEALEERLNAAYNAIPAGEFKKKGQSAFKTQIEEFEKLEAEYKAHIADIRRRFPTALGWNHDRFDIDILSDANGVSIQRFQMVLWTVVLGFLFVHEVVSRLSMPEFSATMLLLMGISNGAYLLGKSSEPQATPPSGHTAPDPAGGGDNADAAATEATVASPPGGTNDAEAAAEEGRGAAEEGGGLTSPP